MNLSILVGGKAGQGPNIITHMFAEALVEQGYYVFYSRDYESLIRGGHNFNVLSFSEEKIDSNESKIDILVCLDEKTEERHKSSLKKGGLILKGHDENMFYLGALFKIFGLDFALLKERLKKLKKYDENLKNSEQGFNSSNKKFELKKISRQYEGFINGSQGISFGAIESGLDIYYAYPMTPATPILFELAPLQNKYNFLSIELENELSVINAGIGSSITGAKVMVGSSGGGYDLMTEALSEIGQAEIPLVIYISSRPGPGTGVATYTSQADLNLALHSGHGEFSRVVIAPGDPVECQELTSQAFYLSQKFKVPCLILSDKHLSESFYTLNRKAKLTKSEKSTELKRYNSYEHIETGEATEDSEVIKKGVERRLKTTENLKKEAGKFPQYKIYGNEKSENLIVGWGSTKGAIIDAIKDLDARFLQILYFEPFPEEILEELKKAKKVILIENNSTAQLGRLIKEKCMIDIKEKILKYDGRSFFSDELKEEIKRRI